MMNFFKDLRNRLIRIEKLVDRKEPTDSERIIALLRHQLGSINLDDARDVKEMTEDERAEYLGRVAVAWKLIMEPMLKKFVISQEEFMAKNANGEIQYAFSRGTINGLLLVRDELEKLYSEHIERTRPKEGFDRNAIIEKLVIKE